MRLTPIEQDKTRYIAIVLATLTTAISLGAACLFSISAHNSVRSTLSERSSSIAAALGSSGVMQLSGVPFDANTVVYKNLKNQLAAIKQVNSDARSIYIMGQRDGQLFFFVDSEQPGSSQFSAPGTMYPEATTADKDIFKNGQAFVEGPATDTYGTFISGLAPIFKPGTHDVVATLGIDVDSTIYWREVIFAALVPLLVGTVIILIIVAFERMRRHNAQLLALKSELVAVASHELRNPITGIRWAAESLQKISTDARVLSMAKAIVSSAVLLQASTNDILELSHATNSRKLDIAPTDIVKMVKEVIETQSLSAKQHGITLNFDNSWPASLMIDVDADQLKRAFHNIISNAIKYSRDNTLVKIAYQQTAIEHKIIVADQGMGIPAAEQNKVFRGFYRASNAAKSDIPGTGLGLYLVKTVMSRHGGGVSFVSTENKGTVVTLTLPKKRGKQQDQKGLQQYT